MVDESHNRQSYCKIYRIYLHILKTSKLQEILSHTHPYTKYGISNQIFKNQLHLHTDVAFIILTHFPFKI